MNASLAEARYTVWLAWSMRAGLALLVIAFVAYLLGFPPHGALERLPEIWRQPASSATGPRGDALVIAAIAWLASCAIVCLLAVIPVFARGGERRFVLLTVALALIVAVAAFGVVTR